jgi:hypothetical protein
MSEMRELLDTELDAVCGGFRRGHEGNQGNLGHFDFRDNGGFNFGNIVIQENIVEQVGVAVGNNASVTNLLGSQTNFSSIA